MAWTIEQVVDRVRQMLILDDLKPASLVSQYGLIDPIDVEVLGYAVGLRRRHLSIELTQGMTIGAPARDILRAQHAADWRDRQRRWFGWASRQRGGPASRKQARFRSRYPYVAPLPPAPRHPDTGPEEF